MARGFKTQLHRLPNMAALRKRAALMYKVECQPNALIDRFGSARRFRRAMDDRKHLEPAMRAGEKTKNREQRKGRHG